MKKNWLPICAIAALTVGAIKVGTLASAGLAPHDPADAPTEATGQVLTPNALAVDDDGNVYIADYANHTVDVVTPDGDLSTVVGVAGNGDTIVPGPALDSPLSQPAGLVVDGTGAVYLSDAGSSHVVAKVASGALSVVAGVVGQTGPIAVGDAFTSTLNDPAGLALTPDGDLIVADASNQVVVRVDTDGVLSIVAGIPGTIGAPIEGPATESALYTPSGVAVDGAGNIYIADAGNHVVEKVDTSGNLSIVAGRAGSTGRPVPGPATDTTIGSPAGIAAADNGTLYIADATNHVVERVSPSGRLTIAAGVVKRTGGAPTPGPANRSRLNAPGAVAVGRSGDLFIADSMNNVVEKVSGGQLSIVAGTGQTTTLTTTKNDTTREVSRRLVSLEGLTRAVGYAPYLSDDDRSAAIGLLTDCHAGLLALNDEIMGASTDAAAAAAYRRIVARFRVYRFRLPQIALVAAADSLQYGALPELTSTQDALRSLLAGPARAADGPEVQAAMSDLEAQLAVIGDRSAGVGASVVGYTVAQFNRNARLLEPAQAAVAEASAAATTAQQDVLLVQQAIAASGYSSGTVDSARSHAAAGAVAATQAAADLAASQERYSEK